MDRQESQQPIGATDAVGDEAEATVGLLDDTDTKNRSTGQAGSLGQRDGELSYNHERL